MSYTAGRNLKLEEKKETYHQHVDDDPTLGFKGCLNCEGKLMVHECVLCMQWHECVAYKYLYRMLG